MAKGVTHTTNSTELASYKKSMWNKSTATLDIK